MTGLIYWTDTYLFEDTASVLEISENESWTYIILDRTIFYPQGWWQPSDIGTIKADWWIFEVTMCRLSPEWIVYHYGNISSGDVQAWEKASLQINKQQRRLNARNHSAGHLLDIAMSEIGYNLEPWKWFHFPQGCYVEYLWEFDNETKEEFIISLEKKINELVQSSIPVIVKYDDLWDLSAPTGKIPRYVSFEWYEGCGCWGTHVKNSSEIWGVRIRKVKYKKWVLKISYNVD